MVWFYLKEVEKHLDRSEGKLKSAIILFENGRTADSIGESYYSLYHATGPFWHSEISIPGHIQDW